MAETKYVCVPVEPTEAELRDMALAIHGHRCKDAHSESDACWASNETCRCRLAYEGAKNVFIFLPRSAVHVAVLRELLEKAAAQLYDGAQGKLSLVHEAMHETIAELRTLLAKE